ncbi:MAG: geranylgeranylglycerol-phosphate geranylgeranyltransferase [Flavobacteriales bacterium]|nr:geranylgeranylglycerol-phosphate geranylgeranyltransferase [Flavobacteriales bacterium]
MNPVINIIRLTRPVNLLIIVATMYALRYNVVAPFTEVYAHGAPPALDGFSFFLAVCVMVLLAAAGNTINDYFDQKVDRINKPERLIVGKSIKRRVAMILHQAFNVVAVLIGLYLGWKSDSYTIAAIPVLLATVLWIYSPILKKMFLLGNIAVTLCVMAVPLWVGLLETNAIWHEYADMLTDPRGLNRQCWNWIWAYTAFAALLTLIREAQKDLEDLAGDKESGFRTMAVLWGPALTGNYIKAVLAIAITLAVTGIVMVFEFNWIATLIAFLTCVVPMSASFFMTMRAQSKADYTRASKRTKMAMAGGLLFTFVIRWWLMQ